MLTKYRPHLRVLLTHEYYSDGWSRDFDAVPQPNMTHSLRRLDYLYRREDHGFSVYFGGPESTGLPRRAIRQSETWSVGLFARRPYFFNYTELDPATLPLTGRPFIYLSNYHYQSGTGFIPAEVDSSDNALLTRGVNVSNNDVISLCSTAFDLSYDTTQHSEIEIWRIRPGETATRIFHAPALSPDSTQLRVNLPGDAQGLYRAVRNGAVGNEELLYVDPRLYQSGATGVVEIFSVPPVDYSRTVNYYAEFLRPSITWRYYVLHGDLPANELSIELTDTAPPEYPPAITFESVATADLSLEEQRTIARLRGQPARLFRSQLEIPLFEVPLANLALRRNDGSGDLTLISNLPIPDVSQSENHLFIHI